MKKLLLLITWLFAIQSITAQNTAPIVATTTASSITTTTASSGGNVTSDGGSAVTARGVAYALIAGTNYRGTGDGTGTGTFTSSLTGLTPGTTYYYRAYATNSVGTSYGTELSFTTATNPNTWVQKADFGGGSARSFAVGFSIGSKGYLGTGFDGNNRDDFWEYDPSTNTWMQRANFAGTARNSAVGFSIGNKGYIGTGNDGINRKDFYEFDPSLNTWTQKTDFGGTARQQAVGFGIGSKGYMGTGNDGSAKHDIWEYDPSVGVGGSWTLKTYLPGGERNAAVGFSIGTKGYIGTGSNINGNFLKDFWEYDPLPNTWVQKTDFGGTARFGAVGFSIGSKGYIGTGIDFSNKADFWEYDPSVGTWTQKTNFGGAARRYAVGFGTGTKGYIGTGQNNSVRFSDFWEYTPAYHYRTITSGNWNAPATWESATDANFTTGVVSPASLSPDFNAFNITIQSPHVVTVTADVTTDQTTVNSGGTLIVNPTVVLTLNDGTGVDLTVASGGSMTIKSISTSTGSIGNSTTATIAGDVTVERYISSDMNRAYRLLGPSVTTSTSIHANWQEAASSRTNNPKPGYGTHITGTTTDQTNGFDGTITGQGSMFTYDQTSDAYVAAANTNTATLDAKTGLLLYIRGDRSIDLNSTASPLPSTNTTLRATGSVLSGVQTFSSLSGNFSLVTNPYPSAINWGTIYANNSANFATYYTYVDPNIGDRGGYVTVTNTGTPSVVAPNSGSPAANANIQSGQAFFVKVLSGTQTLTVREIDKSTTNNLNVFRATAAAQKFTASLFYNSATQGRRIADGVTALYDNTYNAALDVNDAIEFPNFDENIAIARAGTNLSIEERPIITSAQTMPLFISNMKQQAYEWEFNPTNFAPNMVAQLVDKFTGVNTYLNINAATVVPFTVTADAASSASDRFYIQFSPSVALPVTLSSVKAYQKGTGVQVEWTIQQESNMDKYEVERSANGQSFTTAGSVASKGNSNVVVNYNYFDAVPLHGVSFYRIKSVDKNGKITYSVAVKVNISSAAKNAVTVSPNPVTGSSVAIQINLPKGTYTFVLTNKLGQQLAYKTVQHAGGITTETLEPSADFAAGVYQLKVKGNGINITEQVIKKYY